MPGDPFRIDSPSVACWRGAALATARPVLSWLLRLRTYRHLYEHTHAALDQPFESRVLDALEIQASVAHDELPLIPSEGPLIVASNHPHGAVDGLVLAAIVRRRRADVRILANHLLARIPELSELCFFVDPFGGPASAANSHAGLRAAHLWVRNGGALVVFPAGEVAHERGPDRCRMESPWRPTVGRIALATRAPVVPAFIAGANTKLFYAAGRLHPALRTALLAREFLNKRGASVAVRLGPALSIREGDGTASDARDATESIRQAVEQLRQTARPTADAQSDRRPASCLSATEPIPREIAHLSGESSLVESGAFQVFVAEARQIPATLREIRRLREVTFRRVGEGTGRALDLDAFDERYLHLFSWDRERQRIVGAYRIGATDRIMATGGITGLYTRTLFRYDERLIARLSPALELGRSFVRAEYQKSHTALLLLWKGIGQFVARHPQYRVLFGPVSISSRYSDTSHGLLMDFLRHNHRDRDLAELVDAITPCAVDPAPAAAIPESIDEVNRLVARAEADGKGVPVLLRQYLKLNAKLLGFNVDPQFGDALDALMMVDLTTVDQAILNRYLGRDEAARFLAWHRSEPSSHAA
jgi:putative hemolysin